MKVFLISLFVALIFPSSANASGGFSNFPAYGDQHWKAPVASSAVLPVSGNFRGDIRLETTGYSIWVWNGSSWQTAVPAAIVTGPGSSTDNALVRWDGTLGNTIQNSLAILSDAGLLSIPNLNVSGLTASTVPYLDASKNLASSVVTPTQLGYLDATSSIQTQLNGKQSTLTPGTISTSTTGVSVGSGSSSTVGPNVTVNVQTASGSQPGLLGTADWTIFNGKQAGPLTGDVTTSGAAATLATVNSNVGSFGSSTAIPAFTVNAKGLITAASSSAVIAPAGTLTGTTLASGVVTSSLTTVGAIGSGTWNGTPVGAQYGGTGVASLTANNVILGNGTSAVQFVAPGSSGNVLQSNGSTWISSAPAAPKVTTYTSSSGTFSKTGSPLYIRVRMVGGGGGGGASGTTDGTAAGNGGNSTFGTTLLVANGGSNGARNSAGGAGGTASLGTGPTGTVMTGGQGGGSSLQGSTASNATPGLAGAMGGSSSFGGAGAGANQNTSGTVANAGGNAAANSGSGGGGSGAVENNNAASGSGGGAGGFVDAIITSPSSTYSYAVGAGGSGQLAGTNGAVGGAGAAGYIEVTEYYQ